MIGNNWEFIFIEPPKNATTSIRNWIESHVYEEEEGPWRRHWTAKNLHGVINPEVWDLAYKFSVVRNPYSRLTSEYLYYGRLATKPSEAEKDSPHTEMARCVFSESFKDFLSHPNDIHQAYLQDSSQVNYLRDVPKKNDIIICRMENLAKDFSKVCKDMGWSDDPLPHHNVSIGRKPWKSFYNNETLQLVNKMYAHDLNLFQYPKYTNVDDIPDEWGTF
jgi:hypothetical protein